MCLIIFSHQAASRYPLVVAANRDEFFTRSTEQAKFWSAQESNQRILAGKDLVAGGTWIGITRTGRFAAVTNIRDPSQLEQKTRSRGELTRNFLAGTQSPQQFCDSLIESFEEFAGYNLLVGDGKSLFYVNNHEEKLWQLESGVYGLSNGLLNSAWPKVELGKQQLQKLLGAEVNLSTDVLIAMMGNRSPATDADLPDTGVPIELERKLSATFIHNPGQQYGTRCSTAIIMEHTGMTRFSEQNYDEFGNNAEHHFYQFNRES
ncbi:MAG: NRDE family protein [Proteobacteria bacterium]|nr:NRDE family protein [Pseudomonadota bacterium]